MMISNIDNRGLSIWLKDTTLLKTPQVQNDTSYAPKEMSEYKKQLQFSFT